MASVKEKVKESLVGAEGDATQLTAATRADFMQHAIKDEDTQEFYLDRTGFVDAIAPPGEDYVSPIFSLAVIAPAPARANSWDRWCLQR